MITFAFYGITGWLDTSCKSIIAYATLPRTHWVFGTSCKSCPSCTCADSNADLLMMSTFPYRIVACDRVVGTVGWVTGVSDLNELLKQMQRATSILAGP